jgi:enoyl-CoA hydratase
MSVELLFEEDYALLTINRPEALNALSFEIITQIGDALRRVSESQARVLIVTGAGEKAFCAGADIQELIGRSLAQEKRGAELGQSVFLMLDRLKIPSIALMNGYAFGGGLELALACTFRLATPQTKMGLPELKLGLIPGYGGTQRLPRLIGESRAMEMILTAQTLTAQEALDWGVINRIVDSSSLEEALSFAGKFTRFSSLAVQFAREAVSRAASTHLEEGLRAEADLSTLAYRTDDAKEGLQAFLEKREAKFRGS